MSVCVCACVRACVCVPQVVVPSTPANYFHVLRRQVTLYPPASAPRLPIYLSLHDYIRFLCRRVALPACLKLSAFLNPLLPCLSLSLSRFLLLAIYPSLLSPSIVLSLYPALLPSSRSY